MRKFVLALTVFALIGMTLAPAWAVKLLKQITPDSAAGQGFKQAVDKN